MDTTRNLGAYYGRGDPGQRHRWRRRPDVSSVHEVLVSMGNQGPLVESPVAVGERWPVSRRGTRGRIPYGLRQMIYRRDYRRCQFCGATRQPELDHIVPWSAGGPDNSANLRTLCHECNTSRSSYRTGDDVAATPIVLACDECIRDWARRYGMVRYGRIIPGAEPIPVWCGNCEHEGTATDPARLR